MEDKEESKKKEKKQKPKDKSAMGTKPESVMFINQYNTNSNVFS